MTRSHRPFQLLAVVALLLGATPLALGWSEADPRVLAGALLGWSLASYLMAALGGAVAAASFAPAEPLRAPWLILSASYLVLVAPRVLSGAKPDGLLDGPPRFHEAWLLVSLASSALQVAALWGLARAWRGLGLDAATPASRWAWRGAALALVATLVGPDLVQTVPAALRGDGEAFVSAATDVLDGLVFALAVPVLRAALALGGGLAAWPWALLTASVFGWVGYDAFLFYGTAAGLGPREVRLSCDAFAASACAFAFAAGLAQRWVMSGAPGDRPG